jgi:Uncharacterised protein family (UPF0158)
LNLQHGTNGARPRDGSTARPRPRCDSTRWFRRTSEAFIDTVTSPQLEERLSAAIEGHGAFRRFKDVLIRNPAENKRWFAFKGAGGRERVLEWLADEGIEPVEEIG